MIIKINMRNTLLKLVQRSEINTVI